MTTPVTRAILRLAALLLALLALPLPAQFGSHTGQITLRGFTITGQDDDGQTWRLTGARTVTNGHLVTIDDFTLSYRLRHSGGDRRAGLLGAQDGAVPVRLQSPACTLDSLSKEIKSDASLSMTIGGNVRLSGIGYDVDILRKVVLLRSTVAFSMKVRRGELNLNRHKETHR